MTRTSRQTLNEQRAMVSPLQRDILDYAWHAYTNTNGISWPLVREIEILYGPPQVVEAIAALPAGAAFSEQDRLQLSLLGVLLGTAGPVIEDHLIAFLAWLQESARRDPTISLVQSEQMPRNTIGDVEYRDLGWAVRLLEIHEGHHAPGSGRWHLRVSSEIAKIAHAPDVRVYLEERAFATASRVAAARGLAVDSPSPDVSAAKPRISEVTRRAIADHLVANGTAWAGRLQEDEFLSRLYDLEALPSTERRYSTAAGDIWQHRVANDDWDRDWVFLDRRFDLLHGSDADFLKFLCQTIHPVVRPDADECRRIVDHYNAELRRDGWELFAKEQISGRPVYSARKTTVDEEIFEKPTGWPKVDRQMGELRLRLREAATEEQFQSVGLFCREALISVAQAAYDRERHLELDEDATEPSSTDAKRMLTAYFAAELSGSGHEVARKHARAAIDLANHVQHDRGATFQDAALCAEATLSVIRIVAIVSGRRERTGLDF